ncbi:MAG TPA: c-type cytochrome, partial [Methyloceanibacter sp.]|nr:c-type cytochrome [Methyloceanibacter sp.]
VNCHLDAGLMPFAAPFVSTFATFPMLVDDQVITLKERINGCMQRSMNGKELPVDGPEMEALIAYIKFLGEGTPEGVRVSGMGLLPLADPPSPADKTRGEKVYADLCASCHKADGQGERNTRRREATIASMLRLAWPSSLAPRPISAPTCPSVSAIKIRCSPLSRHGMWQPI